MKRQSTIHLPDGEIIHVGPDVHNKHWHVTIRTADLELFHGRILEVPLQHLRCTPLHIIGHQHVIVKVQLARKSAPSAPSLPRGGGTRLLISSSKYSALAAV